MAYLTFVLIVVVVSISIYLRRPMAKGRRGEIKVARELARLEGRKYTVFTNLLVRSNNGTSQIDHVVVSRYGIHVIETKNFAGWIHGSEKATHWTQSIYHVKQRFNNPVKQNWAHVYALKELLSDFNGIAFHPIVAFVGEAELMNVHCQTPVVYLDELVSTIEMSLTESLSDSEVRMISERLNNANILDIHEKRNHVNRVRLRKVNALARQNDLICLRCSGKMVLRSGRFGEFYGCSNYPKCKHTSPI